MVKGTVVVVPGIGGSDLVSAVGNWLFPGAVVWLNPAALLAGAWRVMELAADGITPPFSWWPLLDGSGPLPAYYGTLIDYLAGRGWRVDAAGLDWRGTIARDGARLADTLHYWAQQGPVRIVAHSRGGLVARHALSLLSSSDFSAMNLVVTGLAVPHQGSLSAVGFVAAFDETIRLLAQLISIGPGAIQGGYPPAELQRIVSTWPGPYELLPNPASDLWRPADVEQVYTAATYTGAGLAVSAAWLAAGRASWASLPPVPSAVQWVDVAGYPFATPRALDTSWRPVAPVRWQLWPRGDGVVLVESAHQDGRPVILAPSSHGAIVYDGRVLAAVAAALDGDIQPYTLIEGKPLA